MSDNVLLVTPRSIHYFPPEKIASLDKSISLKYSNAINVAVQKRLNKKAITYNAFSGKYCVNMGLLMLGSVLKDSIGNNNVFYEFGDYFDTLDLFTETIVNAAKEYSVICFTATIPQMTQVDKIAKLCKVNNPDVKIILGGPNTFQYMKFIKPTWADSVIIGGNLSLTSKIITDYVKDKKAVVDLESFTYQDYPIDFKGIPKDKLQQTMLYSFTSYGCPRDCAYCMEHKVCTGVYYLDIRKKIEEIKYIVNEGNTKFVHLADSDFFLNLNHANKFVDALEQTSINACFSINLTPHSLIRGEYREILQRFINVGLVEILIGVEHTSEVVLNGLSKKYDLKRFETELRYVKHTAGMPVVSLYTLVGLPFEMKQQIEDNIQAITKWKEDGIFDFTFPKFFVPYPGTDVFESPARFNVEILSHDHNDYHRWCLPRPIKINDMSDDDYLQEIERLYNLVL